MTIEDLCNVTRQAGVIVTLIPIKEHRELLHDINSHSAVRYRLCPEVMNIQIVELLPMGNMYKTTKSVWFDSRILAVIHEQDWIAATKGLEDSN